MVRYLLVFACSLILMLPPGWCCHVVTLPCCARHGETTASGSKDNCCSSCCGEETKTSTEHQTPTPKPPTGRSCCCDPQPTLRSNTNPSLVDLAVVAPTIEVVTTVDWTVSAQTAVSGGEFTSAPLHLLHCIWLC